MTKTFRDFITEAGTFIDYREWKRQCMYAGATKFRSMPGSNGTIVMATAGGGIFKRGKIIGLWNKEKNSGQLSVWGSFS